MTDASSPHWDEVTEARVQMIEASVAARRACDTFIIKAADLQLLLSLARAQRAEIERLRKVVQDATNILNEYIGPNEDGGAGELSMYYDKVERASAALAPPPAERSEK